ncbi:MAG: hypothetical protein J5644_06740 [Bacteroidales bacterium]|nr:hypothetical protein [Bacteroidales bacterium]
MKKLRIFILIAIFSGSIIAANAQAPYTHSVGVTLGTTQALSFKTFAGDHFAIQLDLGTKYTYVYGTHLWTFELAPNFMYEGRLYSNLYGFVGGGGSIGYCWKNYHYFNKFGEQSSHNNCKGGLNGFFGLEYKFQIPLTLQLDFRPGYRCIFNKDFAEHCFDWGLNFGVRYTF